ncbi:MAG TPA: hypothetical protein VFF11_01405, partial [Candidatus Binatia bacterium]|nr:hypothetical protein [Candidatus Binatia bacterium]
NKFLDRFCGQAACGAKCEKNFWPLNLLHTPLLQEQAAAEAGRAVIIILSLVTKTGLPEVVQEWLSRWLDYREDRPYVFGVLLDGKLVGANDNNPVMACVEKFAGRAARKF